MNILHIKGGGGTGLGDSNGMQGLDTPTRQTYRRLKQMIEENPATAIAMAAARSAAGGFASAGDVGADAGKSHHEYELDAEDELDEDGNPIPRGSTLD